MGTMNCLACGHHNSVGEESCAACSASLRLTLCANCEAINPEDALRCHNCSAERSQPSALLIPDEPSRRRRGLRAALFAVPVLVMAAFAGYYFSEGVPEAQAVTVTVPKPREPETKFEPPKASPAPRAMPRVTHTRGFDSASSGGATGSTVQ
jgi:hypothetical protein